MFTIELHDNALDDPRGTKNATVGRGGTIDYVYQVEMWLQDDSVTERASWVRAYAMAHGVVQAAWRRDADGALQYVGRTPEYDGEWQLPFASPNATKPVTGRWGTDATTMEEATAWAATQLRQEDVATVVMLDDAGLFAAWEPGEDGPQLVATRGGLPS